MKKTLALLLILAMLLSLLAGCAEEKAETTDGTETGVTLTDQEAVAQYLERIHSGVYAEDELYAYENLEDYFILGQYLGLTYPMDSYVETEVSDEDVEDYLTIILMNNAITDEDFTELAEGVVHKFDVVHIRYEGSIDGELQDSASTGADGADLIIGSGAYIDGFETGLIGHAVGSTVELDLVFSPYYDEEVAGKPVHFEVTIEKIQRPKLPELTVEIINQIYGASYANLDSVRAALKSSMQADQESRAYQSLSEYLQSRIVQSGTIVAYPEREMQHYRDHFTAYFDQYAKDAQMDLETYLSEQLGVNQEEFQERQEEYAKASCESDLLVFSIARREGFEAGDDQVQALILGLVEQSEEFSDAQSLIDYYIEIYGPYYFVNRIISATVAELVVTNAQKE